MVEVSEPKWVGKHCTRLSPINVTSIVECTLWLKILTLLGWILDAADPLIEIDDGV